VSSQASRRKGLFVVAGAATLALSSAQTYLTGWVGERVLADLRNRLFGHLQRLSLGYYERNRTGAIVSRITNGCNSDSNWEAMTR